MNGHFPSTAGDMIAVMKSVPDLVKEHNDQKGVQLEYKLLPLAAVEKTLFGKEMNVDRMVEPVDEATIHDCELQMDKLTLAKHAFNALYARVKHNAHVLSGQVLVDFNQVKLKTRSDESRFRMSLRDTLVQVRSNQRSVADIRFTLLDDICRELDEFVAKMKSVSDKLDFIDTMRTQYGIDTLSKKESIENLRLKSSSNHLYMFFTSDELKAQQPETNDKHLQFIIQQSNDPNNKDLAFYMVDLDLHPQANQDDHQIKIKCYTNRQLQSAHLLKEEPQQHTDETSKN